MAGHGNIGALVTALLHPRTKDAAKYFTRMEPEVTQDYITRFEKLRKEEIELEKGGIAPDDEMYGLYPTEGRGAMRRVRRRAQRKANQNEQDHQQERRGKGRKPAEYVSDSESDSEHASVAGRRAGSSSGRKRGRSPRSAKTDRQYGKQKARERSPTLHAPPPAKKARKVSGETPPAETPKPPGTPAELDRAVVNVRAKRFADTIATCSRARRRAAEGKPAGASDDERERTPPSVGAAFYRAKHALLRTPSPPPAFPYALLSPPAQQQIP
ncbi:hypothetical protein JCM10450v2_006034 [Rhodotorula kratochvilovae]